MRSWREQNILLLRITLAALSLANVGVLGPSLLVAADAAPRTEQAVFAGGCFWCTELAFEQVKGVLEVESGYCGGTAKTARYDRVHRGTTRHAEVVRVTYDPAQISYEQLLDVFFAAHDPTQLNRQGDEDVGRHYRSAIFYVDDVQQKAAEAKIRELTQNKTFRKRIVTRLEPLVEFFPAEDGHQDFARLNFYSDYIQRHAVPRACNVRVLHPELIAPGK
ncbi:MAG: peptide-methionine (S)-S-oxide reductase MsrA [Pirellulales bacterium]